MNATITACDKGEDMNAIITACDKDSSAGYVKSFQFENKKEFLEQMNEFESEIPFSRWFLDVEADNSEIESLLESWLEENDD